MPLSSQDLVLGGAQLRLPIGRGVVVPQVDARAFRAADRVGQGWVAGAGASLEWPVGPATVLVPTVRGRIGSYDPIVGRISGITGFDVGLTLRQGRSR